MGSREEQDLEVDLEAGQSQESTSDNSVSSANNDLNNPLMGAETSLDLSEQKQSVKKTRKASSKPPRPPKGPTLSANDHKFMKEITELAKRKRARIERMRNSLRRAKAGKSSSSSSFSSQCMTVFSMIVTILFFGFLVFHGFFAGDSGLRSDNSPAPIVSPSNRFVPVQFYNEFAPVEQTDPSPSTSFRYTRKRVSGGEDNSRDVTR